MGERRVERYALCFRWRAPERTGAILSFPCTANGTVLEGELLRPERARLNRCLDHSLDVRFAGIRDESYTIWTAAVGQCEGCAQLVELRLARNHCRCGLSYTAAGVRLDPPSVIPMGRPLVVAAPAPVPVGARAA
jgi:hypothetical protein